MMTPQVTFHLIPTDSRPGMRITIPLEMRFFYIVFFLILKIKISGRLKRINLIKPSPICYRLMAMKWNVLLSAKISSFHRHVSASSSL